MKLAEWIVGLLAIMGTLVWCAVCIAAFAWLVDLLVSDGPIERALVVGAAFAGLVFALWCIAKASKLRI